nr:hypothetical protein [Tanacetum cinerariifolium]
MSSDPNYHWEDLLDIIDSDFSLTPVLRLCNRYVRETITITLTQNAHGIVQVWEVEKKPVRIIPGPAGIVQLAKIRKQSDIHEGVDESVLLTQDGCLRDIKTFLRNGKLEQVVAIIKSFSLNALGDLKVTVKVSLKNVVKVFCKEFIPCNGSSVGGSEMLMEEEEIVKFMEEEEMADLKLHVCGNVIDQEDIYKFDEEALDLILEKEARESRAHEEWLEKFEGGGALGANKAITHVVAILLYPLRVVEAAFALDVDAMRGLDLVKVEAVGALDLMEVEAVGALDLVEVGAVRSSSSS